jgi:cyclohexanecarboxylate-CoA ligase
MVNPATLTSAGGWWALIERRADAAPASPAFVDSHGSSLTSREYRDQAEQVAAWLWESGIRPGMTVSWQLPTSLGGALMVSALARLGVRQNPLMPVLRDAEIGPMLEQLRPEFLIVPRVLRGYDHGALGERLTAQYGGTPLIIDLDAPFPLGDAQVLAEVPADDPGDAIRWVFFTSGTTGKPKGVKHTDASVLAGSDAALDQLGFTSDDVMSIVFPITHIGGPAMMAVGIRAGTSIVLVDIFDAARTPFDLAAAGVTMLGSAGPFFEAYLAAQQKHGAERLFTRLRLCINGGAPLPPGLNDRIVRELGVPGMSNGYGLTEVPMISYPRFDAAPAFLATGAAFPGPGVELRIVGADDLELPPGKEGEIRLRGPMLTAGYVDPAQEVGAFDAQGFFRTGDLGIRDPDGSYRVTGRLKDIIIRNAENIAAPEIEEILSEHPAIAEVSVVGVPDPRTGERCCAVVVVADGQPPVNLADLAAFCRSRGLASFKIPEQLEIVESLPRNPMGKVLKAALREKLGSAS